MCDSLIHMNAFFTGIDLKQNRLLLFGLLLCAYFSYHLFYGPRSLPYLQKVEHQNVALNHDLNILKEQKDDLESKVVKLRPETLDTDLLKERARIMLGYVGEKEIIVLEE